MWIFFYFSCKKKKKKSNCALCSDHGVMSKERNQKPRTVKTVLFRVDYQNKEREKNGKPTRKADPTPTDQTAGQRQKRSLTFVWLTGWRTGQGSVSNPDRRRFPEPRLSLDTTKTCILIFLSSKRKRKKPKDLNDNDRTRQPLAAAGKPAEEFRLSHQARPTR